MDFIYALNILIIFSCSSPPAVVPDWYLIPPYEKYSEYYIGAGMSRDRPDTALTEQIVKSRARSELSKAINCSQLVFSTILNHDKVDGNTYMLIGILKSQVYLSYSSEIKQAISNLVSFVKEDYQNTGIWKNDEILITKINDSIKIKWEFDIQLNELNGKIVATSTDKMPGGAGHQVIYNIGDNQWSGYGIQD